MDEQKAYTRELVEGCISWDLIEERLLRYPAIRAHFSKHLKRRPSAPYHCHPMAWRLGTWSSEGVFARLDDLLRSAASLPGWSGERGLFSDRQYGSFWALLWQLQVAEWLVDRDLAPRWQNPGPDLQCSIGGQVVSLECYSSIGAYGAVLFLEELLAHLDERIELRYEPDRVLSSHPMEVTRLFESVLAAVDASRFHATEEVERGGWPVVLFSTPQPETLRVQLRGDDMERYNPRLDPQPGTNLEAHYANVLQAAFRAKAGKNALRSCRPNVVMINLAVQEEFQVATHILPSLGKLTREFDIPGDIDGIVWAITGIDDRLRVLSERCHWVLPAHPLRSVVGSAAA